MAQTEDTELRDLVIEALEKNGSLAKIRALLRANVFLAFEDDFDNIKQNTSLDNVLKLPEGILALSVVHEFLEYCNLKNTLFVYMSESRQGKEYNYEGKKYLNDKLNLYKPDTREPILITLIKSYNQSKHFDHPGNGDSSKQAKLGCNYRDEENCTYIVHEDSQGSTTSNSQSDNMSDEKNKLHLRLQLDNSDTDTSSDSAREKSSSEYIPSEHFINSEKKIMHTSQELSNVVHDKGNNTITHKKEPNILHDALKDLKVTNSSSDSTSYVELKPYSDLDGRLLNIENIAVLEKQDLNKKDSPRSSSKNNSHSKSNDAPKSASSTNVSSLSSKAEQNNSKIDHKSPQASIKSDLDTAEYSYDFASSPSLKNVDKTKVVHAADSAANTLSIPGSKHSPNKNLSAEGQHSSHSSVSISDVADLISDKSSSAGNQSRNDKSHHKSLSSRHSKRSQSNQNKIPSDDSGDFTDSPVPSLSNLSLDIHSD